MLSRAKAQLEASAETLRGCIHDAPDSIKNALAVLADADDAVARDIGLALVALGQGGDSIDAVL